MSRRKRLLYLADATNVHTQRWVRHFAERGYELTVCSFDGTCCEGAHVLNLATRFKLPLKLHHVTHAPEVKQIVASLKPDILHAHYASSYGLLGALARFHPF